MTKPLNIGMIGYGFMGRAHSNAYRKVNNFFDLEHRPVLKAVCARSADKAKAFADKWGYESVETDWRKLIGRKDIDLIDICTPNNTHAEIALAAAQAGKMILCEKPLAMTAAESAGLVPLIFESLENGVETEMFSPQPDRDEKRKELSAEGKFLVCYTGTIGLAHGLETLIEAAAILQNENPRVQFLLVGEGAEKDRILSLATQRGLTNLRFLGQQPRETVPSFISASDACLVMLKKADLFKTVIPTKMLEFMSCARPVILAVDGQAREIMDAAEAGIFVEPESVRGLVKAIQQLAADPVLCGTLGEKGRKYILRNFSRQQTALDYLKVLNNLPAKAR